MNATSVAIGVDNGGTWVRICILDGQGRILRQVRKPSPAFDQLPAFLRSYLAPYRKRYTSLYVGSKGAGKRAKREQLARALATWVTKVRVTSDVEAAWRATFSRTKRARGIVVIAGTGSIAYGQNVHKNARAGGRGPSVGDEGSGYWLGRKWLEANGHHAQASRWTVRRIAQEAPKVLARAKSGNEQAIAICQGGAAALAESAQNVFRKIRLKNPVPVLLHGSLFKDAFYRRAVLKSLSHCGIRVRLQPEPDVARALARLALA